MLNLYYHFSLLTCFHWVLTKNLSFVMFINNLSVENILATQKKTKSVNQNIYPKLEDLQCQRNTKIFDGN